MTGQLLLCGHRVPGAQAPPSTSCLGAPIERWLKLLLLQTAPDPGKRGGSRESGFGEFVETGRVGLLVGRH